MPAWVEAGLWGLLGGAPPLAGATLAQGVRLTARLTAGIMAFGCGVLISAVAYELVLEAFEQAAFWPVALGALVGSAAYSGPTGWCRMAACPLPGVTGSGQAASRRQPPKGAGSPSRWAPCWTGSPRRWCWARAW